MAEEASHTSHRVELTNTVSADNGRAAFEQTRAALKQGARDIEVDLSRVERIDSTGGAWLMRLARLGRKRGADVRLTGAQGKAQRFLDLIMPTLEAEPTPATKGAGFFTLIGLRFFAVAREFREFFDLLIDTLYWTLIAPLEGRGFNWKGLLDELDRMGAQAVLIVFLINYLMGLIIALLSGIQLRAFGAEIFVADLVVIAFTRELAPIMTAVIISARSGAAIAAELATMKVQEEIDALRSIGISPAQYLVAPRTLGMLIALPLLTMLGMVAGVWGGLHLGTIFMGFSTDQWMSQTLNIVTMSDVMLGLYKSLVFAVLIVLIGCHNGLRVSGGARGVGMATTRAVVMDIFCIIAVDLLFGLPEFFRA